MKGLLHLDFNPERIFGLDILRALAILFVVGRHSSYLLPKRLYNFVNYFIFDGVSIFFVLSGFLIGGILIKLFEKRRADRTVLFGFWKRRWLRTLPNYHLVLIVLCLLHLIFTDDFPFWSVSNYFIFSQNLFAEHPLWFFSEAWSLSIEEWFYLITPVLLFFLVAVLKITARKAILIIACTIILLVTGYRLVLYETLHIQTIDKWDLVFRKQVFTQLDSLMFGVMGAYLNHFHTRRWTRYKNILLAAGIVLFLFSKFISPLLFSEIGLYNCVFSFSLISVATLFVLPFLSNIKQGQGFFYSILTRISLISYSMYLLNLSIVQKWIIDKINWSDILSSNYLIVFFKYSLFWLLTIILSILLYKYYELPVMNLRDRKKNRAVSIPATQS